MLHFRKSKLDVTSSFLMKSSFSQNHICNKKQKSYASFFLVLCLTPFVADITFITLLLSQIYVCTSSHRLFNVPGRIWYQTSAKESTSFQNLCCKCYETYIWITITYTWITITITSVKMCQYNHNYQRFLSRKRFFLKTSSFLIDAVFQYKNTCKAAVLC